LEGGLTENQLVSILHNNESVSWGVAGLIRSAGFSVWVFQSAEEFLSSGQMPRTACLVIDALLPGMGGLQLQSHLAAAGRHIPMVFIVALSNETARTDALKLGAVNVLEPLGKEALLKEIRRILKPPEMF
jgi:FixJ family two-component response regulator